MKGSSDIASSDHGHASVFVPPILTPATTLRPKVSVLVTNFNLGRYVVAAVNSALSQSYNNLEVVICDDGSRDDSLAKIEASFKGDTRVICFTQPNAGQAGAMNSAFAQATGELIAFLDADDVWLPNRLLCVVERFVATPGLGILSHQLRAVDERLQPLHIISPIRADEGWLGWDPLAVARLSKAPTTGLTVHRQVADRIFPLPVDARGHGDAVMVRRGAVLAAVGALHEIHGLWRQHAGNQTGITGPTQAKAAEAELLLRRVAMADHVAFYKSIFGRPAGDENFVRDMTAYDELISNLLTGRPLDIGQVRRLPNCRTRSWWLLLATLPRAIAIVLFRFRRRLSGYV